MRPSDDCTGYSRFSTFHRTLSWLLFPVTSVLFFFDIRVGRFARSPSALSRSFVITVIFLRSIIRGRKINRRRKSRNGRFPDRRGYEFVQLFQQGRNGFGLRSGEFNELVFILRLISQFLRQQRRRLTSNISSILPTTLPLLVLSFGGTSAAQTCPPLSQPCPHFPHVLHHPSFVLHSSFLSSKSNGFSESSIDTSSSSSSSSSSSLLVPCLVILIVPPAGGSRPVQAQLRAVHCKNLATLKAFSRWLRMVKSGTDEG